MNENDVYYKLAKEFRKRDNPSPLGAMIGVVIDPLPEIKISLLNGNSIIDKEQIYLSNSITNRLAIECTMKEFESQNNTFENGTTKGETTDNNTIKGINTSGGGSTESGGRVLTLSQSGNFGSMTMSAFQNQKENKEKGKFILQTVFHLKKGMYVLVIPNIQEDKYFVIDVFSPAKEVNLEWEYYQK